MAVLVMLYGQSGTGKSTSLRNFKKEDVAIVNVSGKPMPFRNKEGLQIFSSNNYGQIFKAISKASAPSIVIDDATYLMVDEYMMRANEKGYDKFAQMAQNFFGLIEQTRALPDDKIVYFIGHTEQSDDGREHFKTIGKMLDSTVTLEGKFTIVLKSMIKDGEYVFQTHNSGQDTVKSPLEMFTADYISNDLKAVDTVIREYYGIKKGDSNDTEI